MARSVLSAVHPSAMVATTTVSSVLASTVSARSARRRALILLCAVGRSFATSAASASSSRISHPVDRRTGADVVVYFASAQQGRRVPFHAGIARGAVVALVERPPLGVRPERLIGPRPIDVVVLIGGGRRV